MNSREQYLQKQIKRQEAQIRVLLAAVDNIVAENEYLASVACGFAWDLGALPSHSRQGCSALHENEPAPSCIPCQRFERGVEYAPANMKAFWDDAVAAAEKQNAEKAEDSK